MCYHQIYMFLRLTVLLTIVITVKSRPDIPTMQAKTEGNSDNAALDGRESLVNNKFLCGVLNGDDTSNLFILTPYLWNKENVTYNILNYPPNKNETEVDNEIARAFSIWSEHTNLIFRHQKTGEVDIRIEFLEKEHGDGRKFNKAVAHVICSRKIGYIHFNAGENWTIASVDGINIFQTAVHEIGHILGLMHIDKKGAVMDSSYPGYIPNFKLHDDDIRGLNYVHDIVIIPKNGPFRDFAVPYTNKTITELLPSVPQDNDLCRNPKIDTIFNTDGNQSYVFKGQKYYKLNGFSVADGYPKLISNGWPGLPGDIDAAFTYKNGQTYFFKGTKHWRYNGSLIVDGYPKEISEVFPGIPDHLDTAIAWGDSGKIFFFKGSTVWIFDPTETPSATRSRFSKYIQLKGLPENLDAVYVNVFGAVEFFKNDKIYSAGSENKSSITSGGLPSSVVFGCLNLEGYINAMFSK